MYMHAYKLKYHEVGHPLLLQAIFY